MEARNVTEQQLQSAAESVGVIADIRDTKPARKSTTGVTVRFGLRLADQRWQGKDKKYQRVSASYFNQGRRVAAVCWHGHRDFFRALFAVAPTADIRTARGHYTSADQFERVYTATDTNIGPPIAPMLYSVACACPEGGF